ncbi:MAG: hypothetical protein HYX72_04645 [Acidobacteria bacterium]|nr:hypothetical protein [Acidobacteriota bacterium]
MCRTTRLVFLFVALFSLGGVVMAVEPGDVFDLDGDSLLNHGLDDWNLLNNSPASTFENCSNSLGSPGSSIVRVFCSSLNPPKIFTQGGSKDPNDTTQWKWKAADTIPDKDTITNAYAAEYISGGHAIFVFGADRFATNGDANIGVWFFQNNVAPQSDFTFGPGAHADGDIFAVSAFTGGGGNPTITVYKWIDACTKPAGNVTPVAESAGGTPGGSPTSCAENNLSLAFASAAGTSCASADEACAAVNSGSITVSWPYLSKFGNGTNEIPANGFFEGGIDITELFGGSTPCFSTFLMETRSSAEPSAVLKGLVAGDFNTCGTLAITKACACTGLTSDTTQFTYGVSGTVSTIPEAGSSISQAFFNVVVTDAAYGLTCTIGSIPANTSVTWGAGGTYPCTPTNTFNTNSKAPTNTASVSGNRGAATGTLVTKSTPSATCNFDAGVCPTSPNIDVTKSCTTTPIVDGGLVKIRVNFSGTVTNTGNLVLTNVRVCEDDNTVSPFSFVTCDQTVLTGVTLNPGADTNYSGSYIASTFTEITPGRAEFHDAVQATSDKPPLATAAPVDTTSASCALCPPGSAACPAP